MSRRGYAFGLAVLALLMGVTPGLAAEEGGGAVEDVILLLQERGVIEEGDATRIIERNRAVEKKESWSDRITFFGDMRARYENIWYDHDPTGKDKKSQSRLRYRFRLGANTRINDHFDFAFRLATGSDSTSRNQSLGDGGLDFFPDDFNVDQAYITYHPFVEGSIPLGGRRLDVMFGKMPNLFLSKVGQDYLIWDSDITPEGIAATYEIEPWDDIALTLNLAYFVADENSEQVDPAVIPVQLGIEAKITNDITVGGGLSYYGWRYLEGVKSGADFFSRGASRGNIPGGLADENHVDIGDFRFWAKYSGVEDWPILVYGRFAKNFSAGGVSAYNAGREDLAWSIGLEVGDKKKLVQLGAGYFWLEANAVPGQMMDSDLFDGHTNAKGWALYGAKEVYSHTDLKFTLLLGEALDDDITWPDAVEDSDRIRLQTDLIVKF